MLFVCNVNYLVWGGGLMGILPRASKWLETALFTRTAAGPDL